MIDWESWPPAVYPCWLVSEWKCNQCDKVHISEFYSGEAGDDDSDSFDFHCECGAYYKKWCRVPSENIIRSGWSKLGNGY